MICIQMAGARAEHCIMVWILLSCSVLDAAAWDLTSPGGTKRQALFLVPHNDPAGPKLVKGKETVPNLHRWLPLTPQCHPYGSVWSFTAVSAVCWQNKRGSEMTQAAFDCCPADKSFAFVLNYK